MFNKSRLISPVMLFAFLLIIVSYVQVSVVQAGTVNLPQTGQTTTETAGDAGDLQTGVAWPDPRFTDNRDGTVTDNLTGLMWVRDGGCFGSLEWQDALDSVVRFNSSASSFGCANYSANHSDWRLPQIMELRSLVNSGKSSQADWLNSNGFSNFQLSWYWSSTTRALLTDNAWSVHMGNGFVSHSDKSSVRGVLQVRRGR